MCVEHHHTMIKQNLFIGQFGKPAFPLGGRKFSSSEQSRDFLNNSWDLVPNQYNCKDAIGCFFFQKGMPRKLGILLKMEISR